MKKKVKAWAVSLYDGTGIWGEASHFGIFPTRKDAKIQLEWHRLEYDQPTKDSFCKLRVFPVTITYEWPARNKEAGA